MLYLLLLDFWFLNAVVGLKLGNITAEVVTSEKDLNNCGDLACAKAQSSKNMLRFPQNNRP